MAVTWMEQALISSLWSRFGEGPAFSAPLRRWWPCPSESGADGGLLRAVDLLPGSQIPLIGGLGVLGISTASMWVEKVVWRQ